MACFDDLPPEILRIICQLVYLDSIPRSSFRTIDPFGLPSTYSDGRRISSTQTQTRSTLYALCLVNRALYAQARSLLFRRVQITLPFSFLLLLRTLGASHLADAYDQYAQTGTLNADATDPSSFVNMVAAAGFAKASGGQLVVRLPAGAEPTPPISRDQSPHPSSSGRSARPTSSSGAGGAARAGSLTRKRISVSRERPRKDAAIVAPSGMAGGVGGGGAGSTSAAPERGRAVSSRFTHQIDTDDEGEVELLWEEEDAEELGVSKWTVTLKPHRFQVEEAEEILPSPLHRWVRVLDFSTFRTQGMRRTIGQGMEARFVTSSKLLALITAAEGLVAFGASETMDSALSVEVLEALLFRDSAHSGSKNWTSNPSRLRGVSIERKGPRTHKLLQSLDLCNCVSPKFELALANFVDLHLRKFSGRPTDTVNEESEDTGAGDDEEDDRGRDRSRGGRGRNVSRHDSHARSVSRHRDDLAPSKHPARATRFPSLQRLGISGLTFATDILDPFVLAFPNLTHLDLSRTWVDDSLLNALAASTTVQLESLSLARCRRITSDSVCELLVDSPVTNFLTELSLEGTVLDPTPITPEDLHTILSSAPCFRSGRLRYVDLGGCQITDAHLDAIRPQPSLLDVGLASCPNISLAAVARLLCDRAPNVQILELTDSCFTFPLPGRPPVGITALTLTSQLIEPCTKTPPLTISQQLAMMGFSPPSGEAAADIVPAATRPRTNLRVIGLSDTSLRSIRDGLGSWKVIRGAGRRGWCVDTSAGPHPEAFDTIFYPRVPPERRNAAAAAAAAKESRANARSGSTSLNARSSSVGAAFRTVGSGMTAGATGGRAASPSPRGRLLSPAPAPVALGVTGASPPSSFQGGYRAFARMPSLRRADSVSQSRSRSRPRFHVSIASDDDEQAVFIGEDEELPSRGRSSRGGVAAAIGAGLTEEPALPLKPREEVVRDLPLDHPRRMWLCTLGEANGHVPGDTGWHSRKMEVLLGFGLLGREAGSYALVSYQT